MLDLDKLKNIIARKQGTEPIEEIVLCPVCGGRVVQDTEQRYTAPPSEVPIGPASMDFIKTVVTGYHCARCGVLFKIKPPPNTTAMNKEQK